MSLFLMLSSLGVVFYLFLLFQLYRDSHRNRHRVDLAHEIEFEDGSAPRFTPVRLGVSGAPRPKPSDEALWMPVAKFKWNRAPKVAQQDSQQPSALATPGGPVNRS